MSLFNDSSRFNGDDLSQSQSESIRATPDDRKNHKRSQSPARKRSKQTTGISKITGRENIHNSSLFNMVVSQDSIMSSQNYSQDVISRIGLMTCRSQDSFDDSSNIDSKLNDFFPPSMRSLTPKVSDLQSRKFNEASEKQITIAPAIQNPFLPVNTNKNKSKTTLWIHSFKEIPRYRMEFEQEGYLGRGNFSEVFKARRRLDGHVYAIKRLNHKIQRDYDGAVMLREVCALATLRQCPYLLQYYGCWIEDSYLWIQTELCLSLTTDIFVINNAIRHISASSTPKMSSQQQNDECSMSNSTTFTEQYLKIALSSQSSSNSNSDVLSKFAGQSSKFTEAAFWCVLKKMSEALEFMHKRRMAHMDIRPANIFFSEPIPCYENAIPTGGATEKLSEDCNSYEMSTQNDVVDDEVLFTQPSFPPGQSLFGSLMSGSSSIFEPDLHPPRLTLSISAASSQAQESMQTPRMCHHKGQPRVDDLVNTPLETVSANIVHGVWDLRLGDLGLCCRFDDYQTFDEGESRYVAAELISTSAQSLDFSKSDIFSLGATLLEMCIGCSLSPGGRDEDSQEWHDLREGKLLCRPGILQSYTTEVIQVLQQMTHANPTERPSASELVQFCGRRGHGIGSDSGASAVEELQREVERLQQENMEMKRKLAAL